MGNGIVVTSGGNISNDRRTLRPTTTGAKAAILSCNVMQRCMEVQGSAKELRSTILTQIVTDRLRYFELFDGLQTDLTSDHSELLLSFYHLGLNGRASDRVFVACRLDENPNSEKAVTVVMQIMQVP
eukprot:18634-Amphidinium_carterae.1